MLSSNKPLVCVSLLAAFFCLNLQNVLGEPFGRLGDAVVLHNSANLKVAVEVRWKHSGKVVCKLNNGTERCLNGNKYYIFHNGSLTIQRLSKNDAGTYITEIFDGDGNQIANVETELCILEAVSQPKVNMFCTVDGRVMLTCSVERGDRVTINWILRADSTNQTLNSAVAKELTLHVGSHTLGNLVCVARNKVSQRKSVPITTRCRSHISAYIALVIFIVVLTFAMGLLKSDKKPPKMDKRVVEEHVYAEMHGHMKNNVRTQVESYSQEQDISQYVFCNPQPPDAHQDMNENSVEIEEIYM